MANHKTDQVEVSGIETKPALSRNNEIKLDFQQPRHTIYSNRKLNSERQLTKLEL
jgi:hypothetical protein